MQCVNCRFENMPGTEACGRCGTSMGLATAVIDVHPPRAQPWMKSLRRGLGPLRESGLQLRQALTTAINRVGKRVAEPGHWNVPLPNVLARLAVPGWAQRYCGYPQQGWLILAVYLALLFSGLIYWGTGFGGMLLGLAFTVHTSSALFLLGRIRSGYLNRLAMGFIIGMVLALGVYLPAGMFLDHVAHPLVMRANLGPLQSSDVLLVNRWAYRFSPPQPGDVVWYQGQGTSIFRSIQGNMMVREGERFDRILALQGSTVLWENGQLLVDGVPSPWRPLNDKVSPERLELIVPDGCVFILPSILGVRLPPEQWQVLSCVPVEQIEGMVYWRYLPWSRFGRIR